MTALADAAVLRQLRAYERRADQYRRQHRQAIQRAELEEQRQRVLIAMPAHLADGHQVWCRNGRVAVVAAPCSTLECPFKPRPSAVIDGTSQCQQFQITTAGADWPSARHLEL